MIRVSVMAKDSFIVQAVASILAEEIVPNVLQLTYLEPRTVYKTLRDPRSVLVNVQEGESKHETVIVPDLIGDDHPLLVIMISLRSRNIHIFKSYQLASPGTEYVVNLVRDFGRANLRRKVEGDVNLRALQNKSMVTPLQAVRNR